MSSCCVQATDQFFDKKYALRDLRKYRRKGPGGTTRLLVDALRQHKLTDTTLLDVGGGIGMITHEVLAVGGKAATIVDMSSASLALAKEEAVRLGTEARLKLIHGDVVQQADAVPVVDVVALDRVVCCYPAPIELLDAVLGKCTNLFAISYPRPHAYARFAFWFGNKIWRLSGHSFQTFVHSEAVLQQQIRNNGFEEISSQHTLMWQTSLYQRVKMA
ncbi:MAG: class I SAM-dependent methyltransferase [Bacteroidota bacterium]